MERYRTLNRHLFWVELVFAANSSARRLCRVEWKRASRSQSMADGWLGRGGRIPPCDWWRFETSVRIDQSCAPGQDYKSALAMLPRWCSKVKFHASRARCVDIYICRSKSSAKGSRPLSLGICV
ncbi:hypothetical protein H310_12550 [Aphanomyces invadans]|uniref:Uncharacterized protein n=1 Tax=Aphanomyces invadans TaxID=157072 RepID=A0A024THH7_9STRA|nr:hypothetical protein H310_12550 [Aphanomyces invadans]ETV93508.1 hypothetical protein H310_12550 [Aphanomyces invadans]|eukprot:XP_008877850.1 hypothetical protein H310_12550 [Aphanomyces invadans]